MVQNIDTGESIFHSAVTNASGDGDDNDDDNSGGEGDDADDSDEKQEKVEKGDDEKEEVTIILEVQFIDRITTPRIRTCLVVK